GIDPDDVVVAVRRRQRTERFAAISRAMERELGDVDLVLVFRVDVHLVEIERTRAERLAVVDERPARAAVARTVKAAFGSFCFALRVDDAGIGLGDVDPNFSHEVVRESVANARPMVAAVGRLVDAAFGRWPAADDRPRLPLRAPRAGIQ